MDKLNRIQIVLVHPQESGNIGSVCRAMKTMGLHRLSIIDDKEYDETKIRCLAVHAYDIYENSRHFDTLTDALKNSIMSAGATRRSGKKRKYFSVYPEELAQKIRTASEGEISIVFGRESSGLTDDELSKCNLSVNIPSSPDFPSLNLAHAVQVISYSIYRTGFEGRGYDQITTTRLNQVIETLAESLQRIEFFKYNERVEMERFFGDIFMRAGLSQTESQRIEHIFKKIADIKIHKKSGHTTSDNSPARR